jgi:phospholipid/cholesterol/gamma-HCH transport system substrate-binding protein
MSLSTAQRARLGVFMVVGVVLLAIFVSVPIGFKLADRQKRYYAYFEGETLSGLEQGAVVKFHGVPIGKVTKINYDPQNIVRVKVEIRIQYDFPLKQDMYIQTGMMGITGLKYVEILGGSNESPLLKPDAVIPVKASFIESITGKADVIIAKIELLLNNINTFTNPDSMESIRTIFDNVAAITTDVRTFVADARPPITTISYSLAKTTAKIDTIAQEVQSAVSTFNKSIDAQRVAEILQSVNAAATSLRSLSENLDLTIRQTREDFTVSMENLKETMESANELMKVLAENPSLLLKSEPQKLRGVK